MTARTIPSSPRAARGRPPRFSTSSTRPSRHRSSPPTARTGVSRRPSFAGRASGRTGDAIASSCPAAPVRPRDTRLPTSSSSSVPRCDSAPTAKASFGAITMPSSRPGTYAGSRGSRISWAALIFLGGWLENGSAFDDIGTAKLRTNVSVGVIADTLFGPTLVAASADFRGAWRYYIGIGRLF